MTVSIRREHEEMQVRVCQTMAALCGLLGMALGTVECSTVLR